jgi:nicotinamidase/pyrazinamidase
MTRPEFGNGIALIVVDVQNDFAHPHGSLSVEGADAVIDEINELIKLARAAGSPVVYTQDWHPPSTPHFDKDGGIWPVHCVADSWGAQFHPKLVLEGPYVRKGVGGEDGYSGFTMRHPVADEPTSTGLHELLRGQDVDHVVVVGLATDYCVKFTALEAVELGLKTTVVRSAIAAVDVESGDGERALVEMAEAGAVVV